nr:cyclic AMP-binding protein [Dictyostelium discoideum]
MYNPPPPSGSQGNNNYYRQPSSTPGVSNPNPQANQFLPPQPSNTTQTPGGYPPQQQQRPPTGAPQQPGGYPTPPPPGAPGGYPPQQQPAGQYGAPPQQQPAGQYGAPQPAGQYGAPQPAGQYGAPPPPPGGAGISLVKNQQISLTKEDPTLRKLTIGLGWDVNTTPTAPFDLDAVVFMLNAQGRVRTSQDFIFYNNKVSRDNSVSHQGDNLTGQGEGDDEVVLVNLQAVSPDVTRLVFAVTIHLADERRQNFTMVPRAFIRVANQETGRNICRYDLSQEGGPNTALIAGEVYRDPSNPNNWSFVAVGKGMQGALPGLLQIFGCQ